MASSIGIRPDVADTIGNPLGAVMKGPQGLTTPRCSRAGLQMDERTRVGEPSGNAALPCLHGKYYPGQTVQRAVMIAFQRIDRTRGGFKALRRTPRETY